MGEDSEALCRWTARKMHPIILLWVAVVFLAMIGLAHFVFHSMAGVLALCVGAFGYVISLVPMVLNRWEYRLTERAMEKRRLDNDDPQEFGEVFRIDELSHIVPIRFGFTFFKPLTETNPVRRFWKLHLTDEVSGEVRVEKADQKQVFSVLKDRGVSVR
ncbi:MAG: hypothetical protein V2I67_02205 [Thermoanaerobaculales bacterium]|nr:hypothetical protein [Thermoanaerobaculales bacterium]